MSVRGSSPPCSTQGHDVVAATRNPARLADFGWYDRVTGVALDAHNPESVRHAFAAAGPGRRRLLPGARHRAARLSRGGQSRRGHRGERGQGGRGAPDRVPGRVRARRRRSLRTSDQPRRSRRGAERRRRSRRGLAGCGDDHRLGLDVVRDAALRRRPVPADADAGVVGQSDRPDLDQRCPLLPRRGRRRRRACRGLRHRRSGDVDLRRPAAGIRATLRQVARRTAVSTVWTPAGVAGDVGGAAGARRAGLRSRGIARPSDDGLRERPSRSGARPARRPGRDR